MKASTMALAAFLLSSCAAPSESDRDTPKTEGKVKIYNVIILDQSGSMESIKHEAMSGYNETVQTIKAAQKKHAASQEHFVTLVLFDTTETKIVYNLTPCHQAKELTSKEYNPNSGTPLYDAMGITLNKVNTTVDEKSNHKVLVSIITDGMENSSVEYKGPAIKKLVNRLKKQGWVFTYIGASHDVEKFASSISVDNTASYAPVAPAVSAVFKKKNESRAKWFDRVAEGEDAASLQKNFFNQEKKPKKN